MRNFGNLALGVLGAATLALASDVHELKKDTFESFVTENDLVLAECKSSILAESWNQGCEANITSNSLCSTSLTILPLTAYYPAC
jgi:hypothetical protein